MSFKAAGDTWDHSPFKGGQLLVHLAIAEVVNDAHDYRLWMHRATLAKKARVSRGTVDRTLAKMVESGWLEVLTEGGGRGNATEYRYFLGGKKPRQDEEVSSETASPCAETASSGAAHPSIDKNEHERAATASPPSRGSKNARTSPVANDLTRGWWDALDKKPIGSTAFVAARGIVQAALDKDWSPDQVRDALARCEPPMVSWKLEEALRRVRRGSGGIDLDAMSR